MPCFHPIPALQQQPGGVIKLHPPIGTANMHIPCAKCLGCRKMKASEWALRAQHEASQWKHNVFITPTYNDAHIPENGDLRPADFTNLIKRLRIRRTRHADEILSDHHNRLAYLGCGEYGSRTERPHYHALIFNGGFADATQVSTKNGKAVYESATLTSLWTDDNGDPLGSIQFGIPDPGAAGGYVAKYLLKTSGRPHDRYYVDRDGVLHAPPFIRMSRRPMIGAGFLDKYATDFTHGYAIQNGVQRAIPRAYRKKLDPAFHDEIQARLAAYHTQHPSDRNHPARLADQERIDQQLLERSERRRSI